MYLFKCKSIYLFKCLFFPFFFVNCINLLVAAYMAYLVFVTSFMFVWFVKAFYIWYCWYNQAISPLIHCVNVCDCMCVYLALNILGHCIPYNIAFICVTISYFMSHYTNMHYWRTLQGRLVIGYGFYVVFVACAAFVLLHQAVCSPQFLCLIPMVTFSCNA